MNPQVVQLILKYLNRSTTTGIQEASELTQLVQILGPMAQEQTGDPAVETVEPPAKPAPKKKAATKK